MEKIRQRIDSSGLDTFRREAAAYMRGESDAAAYYGTVASLGLSSLVPDMAALLPDQTKRAALLSMHSAAHAANGSSTAAATADADGFPSLGPAAANGSRAEDGAAAGRKKGGWGEEGAQVRAAEADRRRPAGDAGVDGHRWGGRMRSRSRRTHGARAGRLSRRVEAEARSRAGSGASRGSWQPR